MSSHSAPLHCPYCAGERLHPHGDIHGAWECRECLLSPHDERRAS